MFSFGSVKCSPACHQFRRHHLPTLRCHLLWPEPPLPRLHGVTQVWSQPSVMAAGRFDTSQLQGSCPRHPIAHYESPACPVTPHHFAHAPHDYSEACTLVRLAVMDSVMHKLFVAAELWLSVNRWRTCTGRNSNRWTVLVLTWVRGRISPCLSNWADFVSTCVQKGCRLTLLSASALTIWSSLGCGVFRLAGDKGLSFEEKHNKNKGGK